MPKVSEILQEISMVNPFNIPLLELFQSRAGLLMILWFFKMSRLRDKIKFMTHYDDFNRSNYTIS